MKCKSVLPFIVDRCGIGGIGRLDGGIGRIDGRIGGLGGIGRIDGRLGRIGGIGGGIGSLFPSEVGYRSIPLLILCMIA